MLAGQFDQLREDFTFVDRAGRIVRVDHQQRLGARGDLRLDVRDVGVPVVVLVAQVVDRLTPGQRRHRGPQRVVGGGDQHLVAVVEQRLHGHGDQLGYTVAQDHVVDVEVREVRDQFVPGDHRATSRQHPQGFAVPLGVRQRVDHVAHDHVRRLETELGRITDVQLQDPMPLRLQASRVGRHRSADLIGDVAELRRLLEWFEVAVHRRHVWSAHLLMVPAFRKSFSGSAFTRTLLACCDAESLGLGGA